MWKPGQLVTIESKVYRIYYTPMIFGVCAKCDLKKSKPHKFCMSPKCSKIEEKYMLRSYFKQVYPKTLKGKVLGVY